MERKKVAKNRIVYVVREDCGVEGLSDFIAIFSDKETAHRLTRGNRGFFTSKVEVDGFDFTPLYLIRYIIRPIKEKCSQKDLDRVKKFPIIEIRKEWICCQLSETKSLEKPKMIGFGRYGSTGIGYCVWLRAKNRWEARSKFMDLLN